LSSPTTKTYELQELLLITGQAHHKAFAATDGVDPDWALWYADHMVERLNVLLDADLTRSDIVYLLVGLSHEQPGLAPGASWPRYYARSLAERYGLAS
jgi:NAD(P)H-hydrate epimerase